MSQADAHVLAIVGMAVSQADAHVLAVVGMAVCWGAFALTWLAGALYNASRGSAQRDRAPFSSVAVIMTVIVLVTFRAVPLADWHALTVQAVWVRVLGLVILAISTAFTLWARLALGIMWSAAPMVKDGHQLRTGGPYAITRHPIYTGIGGMLLGSALTLGAGRWILLLPLFLILYEIKIRMEERLMLAAFPDDYPRYRQQVPQLVPGLRLIRIARLRAAARPPSPQ